MSMHQNTKECQGKGGASAQYCPVWVWDYKEVENPLLTQYRTAANNWVNGPVCPKENTIGGPIQKRGDLIVYGAAAQQSTASAAATSGSDADLTESLLLILLTSAASKPMLDSETIIWDNTVGVKFRNLKLATFKAFIQGLEA